MEIKEYENDLKEYVENCLADAGLAIDSEEWLGATSAQITTDLPDRYEGGRGIRICHGPHGFEVWVTTVKKKSLTMVVNGVAIKVKKRLLPLYVELFKRWETVTMTLVKEEVEAYQKEIANILDELSVIPSLQKKGVLITLLIDVTHVLKRTPASFLRQQFPENTDLATRGV